MKLILIGITFIIFGLYLSTLSLPAHIIRIVVLTFLIVRGIKLRREKKQPAYVGTVMIIVGCLLCIPSVKVYTGFFSMMKTAGKLSEIISGILRTGIL